MSHFLRFSATGILLTILTAVWQPLSAAQPSIRLDGVPETLVFPVPEGMNVVVTAAVGEAQVRSVWLAREKGSVARLMLTPAADGEYQINLAEPVVAAVLGVEARTGQFRVFAETLDGRVLQSVPVRYRFHEDLAGFYALIEGELVDLALPRAGDDVVPWLHELTDGAEVFRAPLRWFDDGEVEAIIYRSEGPTAVTSAYAQCGEERRPFVATATPGTFRLDIVPEMAKAWRKHVNIIVHPGRGAAEAFVLGVRPTRLHLPNDYAAFDVYQRSSIPIPGTGGYLRLHLGDITAGQVIVRLLTAEGEVVVDSTSVRAGEQVAFNLGQNRYVVTVERLVNKLIGRDIGLFAVSQSGRSERARILRLVEYIEDSDIGFVREGQTYTAAEAGQHLRTKFESAGEHVKTLDDFIANVASRSWTTGNPYHIKLPDGSSVEAEAWLLEKKAELFRDERPRGKAGGYDGSLERMGD